MGKKKRPTMTARERKFFDELLKAHRAGKRISVADAARAAGYSPNNPQNARQAGHQALEQLKQRMSDVFDELGLTAKALVTDFLLPLMTAEQTKFFAFRKELKRGTVQVIEERQVADNGTRCFALDMAFKLVGHYAPKAIDFDPLKDVPITINVSAIPKHRVPAE